MQTTRVAISGNLIDLSIGHPSLSLLPLKIMQKAAENCLNQGCGLNPFTSALVRGALESGLQVEHLERLRAIYRERMVAMRSVLSRELPGLLRFNEPRGGFFFWIALPEGVHAQDLLPKAQEFKVSFMPGIRFSSCGGMGNYLRLSFSYYDPDVLQEGVRRLAQVLRTGL